MNYGSKKDPCKECQALDCYNCDWALLRIPVNRASELRSLRKMKQRAILRLQRQIEQIDAELAQLSADD